MSKWFKAGLIITIIGLLLGGIAFVIGMAALDWDFYNLDSLEYTEHYTDAVELGIGESDEITGLDCNSEDWNIVVKKEAGERFSIKYYTTNQTEEHSVTYDKASGKITFINKDKPITWFMMFGGLKKIKYKAEVTIPENIDLTIDGVNLDMDIADMAFKTVLIDSTNANVKLKNVTADTLNFKSTNGDLTAENCRVTGDIIFNATNGDLKFTNSEANSLKASGTNCTVNVSGGSFKSTEVDSTNGDVKLDGTIVSETLNFTGTNMTVQYNTTYKLSDFKLISVSGTNRSFRVNGNRQQSDTVVNEQGTVTLTARGTNITVKVNTAA